MSVYIIVTYFYLCEPRISPLFLGAVSCCLWFLLQQQPEFPIIIKLNTSILFLREFAFPFDIKTKTITDPWSLYKESGRDYECQ